MGATLAVEVGVGEGVGLGEGEVAGVLEGVGVALVVGILGVVAPTVGVGGPWLAVGEAIGVDVTSDVGSDRRGFLGQLWAL